MMSGLSPADQEAAWHEIEAALGKFEAPTSFVGPCEMLVGAGTA